MTRDIIAQVYPDTKFIKVQDAKKKYSLKEARIRSWIRRNQIDNVLLGRERYIDEDQIPAFLKKGKKE